MKTTRIEELKNFIAEQKPLSAQDLKTWETSTKKRVYNGKFFYELSLDGSVTTNHKAWVLDLRNAGLEIKSI